MNASPIALAAEAQAVATAEHGPCRPQRIETWPLPALTISLGMVNGLIREGPLSIIIVCWASNSFRPPMPEPMITPHCSGGELREVDPGVLDGRLGGRQGELREAVQVPRFLDPEPGHRVPVADLAAELDLELGRVEQGQRPDAAPAGAQGRPERIQAVAQRRDHPHAGDDDAAWMSHVASQLITFIGIVDHGLDRRTVRRSTVPLTWSGMLLDVIDRLADGLDLLGLLVGDGDVELFFELHHQLHGVERVGTEVVDEGGLPGDLVLGDSHLLADDFDHALFHGHGRTSSSHWHQQSFTPSRPLTA